MHDIHTTLAIGVKIGEGTSSWQISARRLIKLEVGPPSVKNEPKRPILLSDKEDPKRMLMPLLLPPPSKETPAVQLSQKLDTSLTAVL